MQSHMDGKLGAVPVPGELETGIWLARVAMGWIAEPPDTQEGHQDHLQTVAVGIRTHDGPAVKILPLDHRFVGVAGDGRLLASDSPAELRDMVSAYDLETGRHRSNWGTDFRFLEPECNPVLSAERPPATAVHREDADAEPASRSGML